MPKAAAFRRLVLTDFRSYAEGRLSLDGRPVVLAGANGAGKTNLLEALSLLGPGRGLRGARLDELPRLEGPGGWAVSALLAQNGDVYRLGVGASAQAPDRRVCRIEEGVASGPSAFCDYVRFVWLTPAQDRLFMEGAGERRRFLDRMTLAHDSAHGKIASTYEKAMRQRQKLLEDYNTDGAWLDAVEAQMAEAGVAMAAARRETALMLDNTDLGEGAFPRSVVQLDGELENALAQQPAIEVEEAYAIRLKEQRRIDREAGRALVGPHRSDLLVTHRQKDRPARLCSTGEQKALLIGLVLANARALAAQSRFGGGAPLVMLMDEIAAHLDVERRAALFKILDELGFQTFVTGTDTALFSAWEDRAQAFSLEDGSITPVDL